MPAVDNNKASTELAGKAPRTNNKLGDSIPSRMMETANTTTNRIEKQAPEVSSLPSMAPGAMPVTGWKAYEIYLQNNKKLPASSKNIRGKVVLSFTIGQNGKAEDLRVVQSLNKTMDEEAIRLVKEGPAWRAAESSQSPVITTINF